MTECPERIDREGQSAATARVLPFESVEAECAFWKEQAHTFEHEASRLRSVGLTSQRLYGAKFNAITSALGYACEAQEKLEAGDDEAAGAALARVVIILADA